MDENLRKLSDAIEKTQEEYIRRLELLGNEDNATKWSLAKFTGMQEAFEIVSGVRYIDFWLELMEGGA